MHYYASDDDSIDYDEDDDYNNNYTPRSSSKNNNIDIEMNTTITDNNSLDISAGAIRAKQDQWGSPYGRVGKNNNNNSSSYHEQRSSIDAAYGYNSPQSPLHTNTDTTSEQVVSSMNYEEYPDVLEINPNAGTY